MLNLLFKKLKFFLGQIKLLNKHCLNLNFLTSFIIYLYVRINRNKLNSVTQINKNNDLFEDRVDELAEYLGYSREKVLDIPRNLYDCFPDISNDKELFKSYYTAKEVYLAVLMLHYTRYDRAYRLIKFYDFIRNKGRKSSTKILDYGCGAADFGVVCALEGHNVTLCDIKGGNLEFARWRFEKRNLKYNTIEITEDNIYPDFGEFQLIIAGEVLEHLRNPLTAVENIYKSLGADGYLWLSDYPNVEKHLHGDHLPEAHSMRLNVLNFLNKNFQFIQTFPIKHGYLYRKKD